MMRLIVAITLFTFAAPALGEDTFQERVALEINASRKCHSFGGSPPNITCTYSFKGAKLSLTIDVRDPESNVFTVLSAPSEKGTYLKFGGVHRCAIFSHYGKGGLSEMAHVFISPKTGDVWLRWDVEACAR